MISRRDRIQMMLAGLYDLIAYHSNNDDDFSPEAYKHIEEAYQIVKPNEVIRIRLKEATRNLK